MTYAKRTFAITAAGLLALGLLGAHAWAGDPASAAGSATADGKGTAASFAEAKSLSARTGKPILIEVGAGNCTSCKKFDQLSSTDTDIRHALSEKVILLVLDGEKGEGLDVARMYSVNHQFPTFVLADASGELMDRWAGYYESKDFLANFTSAVENPVPVSDRRLRFRESPNELDARKFGELAEYAGQYAEAVAYYLRADELNPQSETNYDVLVLNAMGRGADTGLFTMNQVRTQADRIVNASAPRPEDLLKVAYTMGKLAEKEKDVASYVPYLRAAVEGTADAAGEGLQAKRARLLPDYALHVENDVPKAVKLQKEQFAVWDKNWTENATLLNNFAWWCFEKKINLAEADNLARKGVELAEPGVTKANILDTVAEICNLRGDCQDAVHYIEMAVAQAPENEYFQKQLERFQEQLALSQQR